MTKFFQHFFSSMRSENITQNELENIVFYLNLLRNIYCLKIQFVSIIQMCDWFFPHLLPHKIVYCNSKKQVLNCYFSSHITSHVYRFDWIKFPFTSFGNTKFILALGGKKYFLQTTKEASRFHCHCFSEFILKEDTIWEKNT